MTVNIRPATVRDFQAWYGCPPVTTCRAWAADVNGELVAITGYTLHPFFVEVFSSIKPGHGVPAKTVYRHAAQVMRQMRRYGLPLTAVADPQIKNSGKFLQRLGFTLKRQSETGDIYEWK